MIDREGTPVGVPSHVPRDATRAWRRRSTLVIATLALTLVADAALAAPASPGAMSFAFVGKLHLEASYCYPAAFCAPGPSTFTLIAGTKNPDPNGGFSDCLGAYHRAGTAQVWGPICALSLAGTLGPGVVFGRPGPYCLDSTGTAAGAIGFYLQHATKARVDVSVAWPAGIGDLWLLTGTATSGTSSVAALIVAYAPPDTVYKSDSCTTGADDLRVIGVGAAVWPA